MKVPIDMLDLLEPLPYPERWTFLRCFTLARRTSPHRGYLVTLSMRPLTIRQLAHEVLLPRSTTQEHVSWLVQRGHLVRDLAGWLLVPIVLEVERDTRQTTTTTSRKAQTTSGENGDAPDPSQVALQVQVSGKTTKKAEIPDTPSSYVLEEIEDVTWRLFDDPGENPGGSLLGDAMAALPPSIHSPDVRYLLAKLGQTTPAWHAFPAAARDLALVERLEQTSFGALLSALEQETLSPTAKNPGAWLARTVAAIAMGQEVAS